MDTLLYQDQPQQLLHMLNSPASISSSFDSSSGCSIHPTVQQCEGDDFRDPVLQYLNRLLMEEDIEDIKCTLHESIAYKATVKNFSDILNDNDEYLSFSTFTCGEGFRVTEQDLYPLSSAEGHCRQETEELYGGTVSETSSVKPSETEFRLQQESEACGLRNTHGNSKRCVSNANFKQQHSNENLKRQIANGSLGSRVSDKRWKQRRLNGTLRLQALNSLKQHTLNSLPDGFISMPGMPSNSRSTLPAQLTEGYYPSKVSTEEPLPSLENHEMPFNSLPVSINSSRLKRSSPEESNSNDDDTDTDQEDTVSFVENKDLKAERYAKALNEDLSEFVQILKKIGPRTSVTPPKSHKSNARKMATAVDLKNMLLSCAQAVGDGNIRRANEILKEIRKEATPYGNDLQRLAHYFAEGLVARITGTGALLYTALSNNKPSTARVLKSHRMYVDVSPFHKVSNLFANRAIVEAAKDACRLHIIDYGIQYGIQWPSLISALAERKGGPPFLRMTMIEFPDPGNSPARRVEWTGQKLSEYARAYGVPFEYQAIADKWENITASSIGLRDGEILVVNSNFRLRHVLDESVMPSDPRTTILTNILEMNPKLFVHGVVNGSYTSPFFVSRFREALSSYSSKFDMVEAIAPSDCQERFMCEKELLGNEIMNVVACEGQERVERPATYKHWQSKMQSVGFVQMLLDGKMVENVQEIVRLRYNKNFNIYSDGNWMLLGWKGKVMKAMTLWRPR